MVSQSEGKETITQYNFDAMLPALASAIEEPKVTRTAPRKEYDPLLAAASDKVPKPRPALGSIVESLVSEIDLLKG